MRSLNNSGSHIHTQRMSTATGIIVTNYHNMPIKFNTSQLDGHDCLALNNNWVSVTRPAAIGRLAHDAW
jgi:hypothetical protein